MVIWLVLFLDVLLVLRCSLIATLIIRESLHRQEKVPTGDNKQTNQDEASESDSDDSNSISSISVSSASSEEDEDVAGIIWAIIYH